MTVLDLIQTIVPRVDVRIRNIADGSTYDFRAGVTNTKKAMKELTERGIIDARVVCIRVLFTVKILYVECYKVVQSS